MELQKLLLNYIGAISPFAVGQPITPLFINIIYSSI